MKRHWLHIGFCALPALLFLVEGSVHFHCADDHSSHGGHAHCLICSVAGGVEAPGPAMGGLVGPSENPRQVALPSVEGTGLSGVPSSFCIRSPPSA